jgi:lysozyme
MMSEMFPVVIDLYHGDKVSSFWKIKMSGILGVIHKATQGSGIVDKTYKDRRKFAEDAGLLWGAYHFGTDDDVAEQADHFLTNVGDTKGLLLALDFETNPKGGSMSLDQAKEFLRLVFEKTGQKPVIYSGHYVKEFLSGRSDPFLKEHRLWLCQYGPKAVVPSAWDNYWLWQYTGDGVGQEPHSVEGCQENIDLSVFSGTEEELKNQWSPSEKKIVKNKSKKKKPYPNIVDEGSDPVTTEAQHEIPTYDPGVLDEEPTEPPKKPAEPSKKPPTDLPWMTLAKSLLGTDEAPGDDDNDVIVEWAKDLGLLNDYNHDSIPWCALFVSHIFSKTGLEVSDAPLWALSYKNSGTSLDEGAYGALLVFKRNGGGHVGFYVGENDDYYHVLGGNQNDSVCIKSVAKENCVGIRWPGELSLLKTGIIRSELTEAIGSMT